MFDLRYKGRLCIPSYDALKDMARHDIPPMIVEEIILDGEDFWDDMSGKLEEGRMMRRGGMEVFAKLVPCYSGSLKEDIWLIKHVGKRRPDK